MTSYIIYGLVDPQTQHLRYIGKSIHGLTRPRQHSDDGRLSRESGYKANWIRGLRTQGLRPNIVVLQEFEDQDILAQAEVHWISYFKAMGCPLTNYCRGGEGFTGPHRPESRAKIGAAGRGRKRSREAIEATRQARLGTHHSDEAKAKMRAARLGTHLTEETKAKIRTANLGRKLSPEHTEKNRRNSFKPLIDKNGRVYESRIAAAEALGVQPQTIYLHVVGKSSNPLGLHYLPRH